MEKEIYQVQIALKNYKPKIWRRILVPSDLLLSDFHKVIQTTMGWENSHLHQFVKNNSYYSAKMDDEDFFEMSNVDYEKLKISDLLKKEKDKIIYEYDFGDGWEHDIILEKKLQYDKNCTYPVCIKGKMSCPPEDCGGVWGYARLLEILNDPEHEEYEDYIDWLDDVNDPEFFDMDGVNELLQKKGYGCYGFF